MAFSISQAGPRGRAVIPLALFLACLCHRMLHLVNLWPILSQRLVREDNIMQLIPAEVWRDHFTAAWLYLQQAPPVPNLLFGVLAWMIDDVNTLTLAVMVVQVLLACTAVALLASLLLRLRMPAWIAVLAPAVLYFGGDMLSMEYNAMGHFYYEQSTAVLCLLASHIALTYLRAPSAARALKLGLCVALLALTRSTFSYFAVPVAAWLLLTGPLSARNLLLFLLPVLVLQGGWAAKNYAVHGYWNVASSSWGGANARTGDIRRSGGSHVIEWLRAWERDNGPFCEAAYWNMAKKYRKPPFFFVDKDWILQFPQPADVLRENERVVAARGGRTVFYDTATFRHYSDCLQKVYLRYWLQHPAQTLEGAWKSYLVFWLPVREFAVRNPIPIAPVDYQQADHPTPLVWLRQAMRELVANEYRSAWLDLDKWPTPYSYEQAWVRVVPALPMVMHAVNLVVAHAALAVFLYLLLFRFGTLRRGTGWELSFPVLAIAYVATLTSLVEWGENMRFRLEVEPLIWTFSVVSLCTLWRYLRRRAAGGGPSPRPRG